MKKSNHKFQKIEEYKDRFRRLPTEVILRRLSLGISIKEAAIAYRKILEERGIDIKKELGDC